MAVLLASGASALVFQLLWIKQLQLVVGVEVHAVAIAVSAFFAGLALGGWWLGRQVDRMARPLRLYAFLELGITASALLTTWALRHAAPLFVSWQDAGGATAWVLPFLLVGLPAILMGGTLPVMLAAFTRDAGRSDVATAGGRLYAVNTAGAIAGTLLAPFLLLPWLGVLGSALFAAVLNLLAAGLAFGLDPRFASVERIAQTTPSESARRATLALALYAIAGGVALGYEVVWTQAVVQFMSTRAFAFAIVLATYLAGLMIGSALSSRHAERTRDPWMLFGLLISAAGLIALIEILVLGPWLATWQSNAAQLARSLGEAPLISMSARFVVAALCIVFVPTVLLGAAFPFALRLVVGPGRVGADTGRVVAVNTLGGIAGSLLTGFVLVPALGLVRSLAVLASIAAALGVAAVWRSPGRARLAVLSIACLTLVAAMLAPPKRLGELLAEARGGTLVAYEESHGATVAVLEQGSGERKFRRLYIQGVSNSGDTMTSLRYMRLQALLPLIVHREEPKSALVIGLGTGITAGALLTWPGLEQRVVAELLPAVVRATPSFNGNYKPTEDPRMTIRVRDGRHELLGNEQRYDLITLEPPPPSAAGVVNLYATEFYRLAAQRLGPQGIVAQWLPLPTQNDADTRALVQSFLAVFPNATLWTTELHEMMLVGSALPLDLDLPRIRQRMAQPEVARALAEVGIASPAALLSTWVTDADGLRRYAGDTPAVTDDRPRIEYAPWVRREEFPATLSNLIELQTEPPVAGADRAFADAVKAERTTLMGFYRAGLAAYAGDRQTWAYEMNGVMRAVPDNPYYLWFGGRKR
jgi:spermidine synthase